ncbi:MAG: PQQ-dependent sugar dehydrogenase [Chloroflexi bacterium]|nr:PQQ-dependent sugar dehydrogenase [Chloroflexota bacterium]
MCATLAVVALAACGDETPAEPPALPPLELAPILGGHAYAEPIEVGVYPGDRLFVAERGGRVLLVSEDDPDGAVLLDITDRADSDFGEGVLSVALDPAFEVNGYLWVYYFVDPKPDRTLLSRFTVVDDAADPASELVVLELQQPGFNQNGGAIRFGPADDLLYLSLGDGSASTDPFENGQNLGTLLGSVIRIDVRESSEAAPYAVPPDNPFVATEGARPEIWAYGLRNPWRMAFDAESGELWLGDVQVSSSEEVDRVSRGDNLGWPIMEGSGCLSQGGCDPTGLVLPRTTYPHGEGRCAVIGGVVYRGEAIEALRGRYPFGEFCRGDIWAIEREGDAPAETLAVVDGNPVSFGTDGDGEVLILELRGGVIFRLQPAD